MDAERLAQIAKMVGELTIALEGRQGSQRIEITREQAARWRQTVKDAARQISQLTVAIEPDPE